MSLFSLDRRTATALLVAAVFFMENLDATIIVTSLPAMALDFGVPPAQLSIGVSAYLIALTVFIPISGWAADRYGARRVLSLAIIVFTLASLLCALSPGLWTFTAARTLQGIGGAMMVPVGRLVVLRNTPKEGIVRALAILTWPALTAPVLGPPIGGWISTHWGWPWIFLLNLPLGIAALVAALMLVKNEEHPVGAFDTQGFLLGGLGVALFMMGIELASRPDLSGWLWFGALAGGLALQLVAARHLLRVPAPLVGLAPLKVATFRVTAVGGSISRTVLGTAPFLLPLMFQLGFGYDAVEAGGLLLWLFAGNLTIKPATTWIMNRFGLRNVLVGNGLLIAAGFVCYALLTPEVPKAVIVVLLFVTGMTRSLQFTALNTIGFSEVPPPHMRDATTLFSVLQQMNAGMGIAIGALSLSIAELLRGGASGQAATGDFQLAFWLVAALAALAIIDSMRLPANAGAGVLRRRG